MEIVPCNSDIGDIGKFKRCDLDRIMTNEKRRQKFIFENILLGYTDFFYTRICVRKELRATLASMKLARFALRN